MTLTAGSTLQNGKYIIEAILHQSDFSVTYRGMHQYLEHSVIIQTFNDSLRHHSRYTQLCHSFTEEVRRRITHQITTPITILDGFEEDHQPFMVMLYSTDQPIPKLRDWLPLTRLITANEAAVNLAPDSPIAPLHPPSEPEDLLNGNLGAIASTVPNGLTHSLGNGSLTPTLPNDPTVDHSESRSAPPATVDRSQDNLAWTHPPASHGPGPSPLATLVVAPPSPQPTTSAPVRSPHPRRRLSPALPIALLFTALVGGVSGAVVGWGLRFGNPDTNPLMDADNPALFNLGPKDQSFPAQENWPITEADRDELAPEPSWSSQDYGERQRPIGYDRDPVPTVFDRGAIAEPEPEPEPELVLPEKRDPITDEAAPVADPPAKLPPVDAEPVNPPPVLPEASPPPAAPEVVLPAVPPPAAPGTNSLLEEPPKTE